MTVKELIEYLDMFNENAKVLVFNRDYRLLDNVESVSNNNGFAQINTDSVVDDAE